MNNKMVNSLLVISALSFAALLTGCGKSKETKAATPVVGELGTPPPGEGRPTGRTPGPGDGTKAPVPVNPPDRTQPPVKRPPVTRPPVTLPPTNPPVTTTPPQTPPNLANSNERVNFDGAVIKTGGLKSAGGEKSPELFYTGSSSDQLLQTLLMTLNFKSDAARSIDMQIARDIKFVKLSMERNTGKRILSMSTDEEGAKAQLFQLIESDQFSNLDRKSVV